MDLGTFVLFASLVVVAWTAFVYFEVHSLYREIWEWLSDLDEECLTNTEDIDNIYRVMAERDRRTK